MTRSVTICWCSIMQPATARRSTVRLWLAPIACCASRWRKITAGFYTAGEFAIGGLIERHSNLQFLELGRSCVLTPYRNKRTVELLWHGIHAYVQHHRIDVMFGCASLEGTDPHRLALPLSFLHHYSRAPETWRARALPARYVEMNRLSKEAIDPKEALRALPPLVKGYLRLGAISATAR